ncbi:Hypothetical protein Nlim_2123 [Candidatus Nitrosarchaeum limnium SFB1]|uniref:Uncharacterized protein n=1 Tax=Candidatus Nitrosarchaeum limnium SFB1 TaxID=886738 RepID=F3KNK8_9ARCH|nr:Hypothetical protein Nlim_2123 [Candidatus Nitrosarchaeum limnium SFB1]
MDVTSLPISNSTYIVSATIPASFMQEPAIKYWLYITDDDQNTNESNQYTIGVKPTSVSNVLLEMDVPTVIQTGSTMRSEMYIKNDNSPSYGTVSLVVDGKLVSKKAQLFDAGQTHVTLEWNVPSGKVYSNHQLQGRVDLYDKTIATKPSIVHTYPRTIAISAYDMKPLEVLIKDDKVLADPALIYASDSNENIRFKVIDPEGRCVIGKSSECLIHDSTRANRGGLISVNYEDQILRVRYSGPDNPLERFSITSIDPLTEKWTVNLETSNGIIPNIDVLQDTFVKIKYRFHSETVTVKSN